MRTGNLRRVEFTVLDDKPDKYVDDYTDNIGPGVGWGGLLAFAVAAVSLLIAWGGLENGPAGLKRAILTSIPLAGLGTFLGAAGKEHWPGKIALVANAALLLAAGLFLLLLQLRMWGVL